MDTTTPSTPLDDPTDAQGAAFAVRWIHESSFPAPDAYTLSALDAMMERLQDLQDMVNLGYLHPVSNEIMPPPSLCLGAEAAHALETLFFLAWSPVDMPIAPDSLVLPDAIERGITALVAADVVAVERLPAARRFRPLLPLAALVRLFHQSQDADTEAYEAIKAAIDDEALADGFHGVPIAYLNGWFSHDPADPHTPTGLPRRTH